MNPADLPDLPLRPPAPKSVLDLPDLFEDEEEPDMGEASYHTDAVEILFQALKIHLPRDQGFDVWSNLNLYYKPTPDPAYVSPDVMVTRPPQPPPGRLTSYRVEEHGPGPILTIEVLSARTYQQRDFTSKPDVYATLGGAEYIMVDTTGQFLDCRLALRRLRPDRTWSHELDEDRGVTSRLGFRIIIDQDAEVRVIDARSGQPYPRPNEAIQQARAEADARTAAEQRIRELEAELARLKVMKERNARRKKR